MQGILFLQGGLETQMLRNRMKVWVKFLAQQKFMPYGILSTRLRLALSMAIIMEPSQMVQIRLRM